MTHLPLAGRQLKLVQEVLDLVDDGSVGDALIIQEFFGLAALGPLMHRQGIDRGRGVGQGGAHRVPSPPSG